MALEQQAFERYLLREGVLTEPVLAAVKAAMGADGIPLVEALVQTGKVTAETAYRALASHCELRYVSLISTQIPPEMAQKAPARFAAHYGFVPMQDRGGALVVAVSDPLNGQLLDDIRQAVRQRIEPVVASPRDIAAALKSLYGVGAETMERILVESENDAPVVTLDGMAASADLGDVKIDASIIKFVNELLAEAIRQNATDVHIEPFEDQLRVRFRIDGVLHGVPIPASIRGYQPAIVSRVKIMANLNIAEKRLPQDGKIRASLNDEQFDLRVSILPTPYGETVNLRILNRSSMFMTLEQLGFQKEDLRQFQTFIERPHGMILVTGPTGSGKTTTLYAALSKLNQVERKIITVEDPIEYQLQGVTQMQVAEAIGFNFSSALRHMLRHDPDVMLVGEIRDHETAEMAIRSSLTGHLVFSTLHTNDAAGAVTRLVDLGLEPYLVATTMIASIAQRLVRRLCDRCAESITPEPQDIAAMGVAGATAEGGRFRRAVGCDACRGTGYSGRVAVYEILPFTRSVQDLALQGATAMAIRREACGQGMRTLRESAWIRIHRGDTTFAEVARVTADAELGNG